MKISPINEYNPIQVESVKPLSNHTLQTISKEVFHSGTVGLGCSTLQSYAKKVVYLNDLLDQVRQNKIDLGKRDRAEATLKCALIALLVVAVVAGYIFALIKLIPALPPQNPGPAALLSMSCVVVPTFAIVLLLDGLRDVQTAFDRPKLQEAKDELNRLLLDGPGEEVVDQVRNVITNLSSTSNTLQEEKSRLESMGANVRSIESRIAAVRSSLTEMNALLSAIGVSYGEPGEGFAFVG